MCKQLLFFCLLVGKLYAQNLVPNPSFEEYINCPAEATFTPDQAPIHQLKDWYGAGCLPDYYNEEFKICLPNYNFGCDNSIGFQKAKTGKGYAGMFILDYRFTSTGYSNIDFRNIREFFGVKLKEPLMSGKKYKLEANLSLANKAYYSINRFGFYFSNSKVQNTFVSCERINIIPQVAAPNKFYSDTVNWEKIEGEFIAQGGEEYLTIGNFWPIDDVDTLCVNVTSTIKHQSYYYIDDVSVECMDCTVGINKEVKEENGIKIYPNPNNGEFSISITNELNNEKTQSTIYVYDVSGRLIVQEDFAGSATLKLPLQRGVYIYTIKTQNTARTGKLLIIEE